MGMNQYLDMFIEESREHLQAINDNLLLLENDPDNVDIVNDVFRSAHTLKGMAATMGFEDMSSLTHQMENVLDQIRNHQIKLNSEIMDVIFQCVDVLESMVDSISEGGDGKEDVSDLVSKLEAILSGEFKSEETEVTAETGQASEETAGKEEAAQTTDFGLDQFEITVVKQSLDSGHQVYYIKTVIEEECLLKSARAYMVFNNLESMGEVIKSVPSVQEIEDENFDDAFEIVFITEKSEDEIRQSIESVSEIASVEIKKLDIDSVKAENDQVAATSTEVKQEENKKEVKKPGSNGKNGGKKVKAAGGKTIRVDIERLDVLMNLFSELVIDRGRLESIARRSGQHELMETVEHMSRISGDLQNIILNMRMVPVETVFNRFPRMIRDLAKELNKKVDLQISGAETELDRTVIDEIGDPLVHLLRNAIDHGLESTEERIAAGKSETGVVELKAYHSGNHVFIEIRDDGKGINRDKVLKKALDKGVVTEQEADSLTDQQVYDLLFSSGFSTAEQVSDISGRGVGLDVVKTKIESLGGIVSVESTPGEGSTFLIQLPLTLSIISAMLVKVEDETYAVPLSSIIETAVYKKDQIMHAHHQDVIDFRGKVVPLLYLKNIFEIPDGENPDRQEDEISAVIVRKGDKLAALVVDSFIGQQEIVLKSMGKYLVNLFAISGATILGDGQVALIIDCNALIK
ncbi:MAG: chemotaxis protein CheA [Bacillaceae bacterium]|nr:chemotaxis protein CheA [Bacillaceae bacterium]